MLKYPFSFWSKSRKMLLPENTAHQTSLFGTDLLQQLDIDDPLLQLADVIPWLEF